MFNSQCSIVIRSDENWDMSGANASPAGRCHQVMNIDQIPNVL